MRGYPPERMDAVLQMMLPPNNRTICEIASETGISEATLGRWRKNWREEGRLSPVSETGPKDDANNPITEPEANDIAKAVFGTTQNSNQ